MRDEQIRSRVQRALNSELSCLVASPRQRDQLLENAVGGRKVKRSLKMSFGLALALVLALLSLTALAVGIAVHQWYGKVAEMERDGAIARWEMADKVAFVRAMNEFGFDMDAADYDVMNDEAQPDGEREAAADRIIAARYGALLRDYVSAWSQDPDAVLGVAPNTQVIFEERYMAEHPEGITAWADYVAYTDALGYFLRDEFYPVLSAGAGDELPQPVYDADYAAALLIGDMTEILSWPPEAAEAVTPTVTWEEEYRLWTVSGEAPAAALARAPEAVLTGPAIEQTETGYRLTIQVDEKGNQNMGEMSKQAFYLVHRDETPVRRALTYVRAEELAEQAVRQRFGLTEEQLRALFCDGSAMGTAADGAELMCYAFHTHYAVDKENRYGAVINMVTGEAEEVFSYLAQDQTPEFRLLGAMARLQRQEGWYYRWPLESKRALAQAGGITDSADEAAIDAWITALCGAPGRVTAVHFSALAQALLGAAEAECTPAQRALLTDLRHRYNISVGAAQPGYETGDREIGAEEAIAIARGAVCAAWEQPSDALDAWEAHAELQREERFGRTWLTWRVFLSRPLDDASDTFDGQGSLSCRVLTDGTLMDASRVSGWLSPAQDRARRLEAQDYDPAAYGLIWRYALEHDLMDDDDFCCWPLADKAALADSLRVALAEKPTRDPRLLALARHAYGLPQPGMLGQEAAEQAAYTALLIDFGLDKDQIMYLGVKHVFLDVTDAPYWKIVYGNAQNPFVAEQTGLDPHRCYAVYVNAADGSVLRTETYAPNDGQTGIAAWDRWY